MTVDTKSLGQLMEVIGYDSDTLVELMDIFLEDAPGYLDSMASGLNSGDAQTLAQSAHTMKSVARDFGLLDLSDYCLQLEKKGKSGNLDGADRLVEQINLTFRQDKNALQKAVSDLFDE